MVSVLQNLLAKAEILPLSVLFILSGRQHTAMAGVSLGRCEFVVAIMWFCQLPPFSMTAVWSVSLVEGLRQGGKCLTACQGSV